MRILGFFLISLNLWAFTDPLAGIEGEEIRARLRGLGSSGALNTQGSKFDPRTGKRVFRKSKGMHKQSIALTSQAGWKTSETFQRWNCENIKRRFFPKLSCEGKSRSSIETNDRVEDLTKTWLDRVE